MSAIENVVEFIKGEETMTITLSSARHMTMIRNLAKRFPEEVRIDHDRDHNGYFLAHLPVSFLKFQAPMQLTEEQREARRERFRKRFITKNGEEGEAEDMDDDSIIEGQEELFYDEDEQ